MSVVTIEPVAGVAPEEVTMVEDPRLHMGLHVEFKKGNSNIDKLYAEEQSLKEVAKAFEMLDVSGSGLKGIGDAKITRDEFKKGIARLGLHEPDGAAPGWKDDAFDRFDVDRNGYIDYNEMCFAMGREVLSAKARGERKTAKQCMQDVIGGLQATQSAAKEAAMAAAVEQSDIARLDEGRREEAAEAVGKAAADEVEVAVEQTDAEEKNDSCFAYLTLAIFPCCIYCHGFGRALAGEKIEGMEQAVTYVARGKDDLPDYRWHIQNYHYKKTRVKTKKGYRTKRTRVNTHRATLTGTLKATDATDVFVPNTRKRHLALLSKLAVRFDPAFEGEYQRELLAFYKRNTRDRHQDKSCTYSMPHLGGNDLDGVHIEWVPGEPMPWWMSNTCKMVTALTWTAVCWFQAMKSVMGAQTYVFTKVATGWHKGFNRQAEVLECETDDWDDVED